VEVLSEEVVAGSFVRCNPRKYSRLLNATSAAAPPPAIHLSLAALTAAGSLDDASIDIGHTALAAVVSVADAAMQIGLTALTIPISVADRAIHINPKDFRF
jgi:hypothetical protein